VLVVIGGNLPAANRRKMLADTSRTCHFVHCFLKVGAKPSFASIRSAIGAGGGNGMRGAGTPHFEGSESASLPRAALVRREVLFNALKEIFNFNQRQP
jgi:hypothetical protein